MKQYQCTLAQSGMCQYGGNKSYDYGFVSGTALFCRLVKRWVRDLKKCPKCTED